MSRKNLEFKVDQPRIAPSILSADFSSLAAEVQEVEKGGADWIHVDVMDGHFVPNLTLGPMVVEALRTQTQLPLDCHLMVSEPRKWIVPFAQAGADIITIHAEVESDLAGACREIRKAGCRAGISINPDTEVARISDYLDDCDLVLVMSVFPGFGGQKFIEETLAKCRELRDLRRDREYWIEIDGGISSANVDRCRKAGVDVFVAGSAIFKAVDRAQAIQKMKDQLV